MDKNREARRANIVSSYGFNRRRYRTNSLRDSPDEGLKLQESVRLRERVKKDRDREISFRDRGLRERDLRERPNRVMTSSIKRRRNERLMNNRGVDTGNDETSEEESVNDEEEDDEDEDNNSTNHHNSSSFSQTHHSSNTDTNTNHSSNNITNISNTNLVSSSSNSTHHHLQHRKSFPLPNTTKAFRAPPVWRSSDEVINVSVPRKARSSSAKRSHDWISSSSINNSVGGGEQIIRQASDSPARQGGDVTTSNQAPTSPSSSNASIRKKLKPSVNSNNGLKPRPPKAASNPSSNPGDLEIEIAEVLYGLMTQSHQGPSASSKKEEVNRSSSDEKSRNSSPVSNSTSTNNNSCLVSGPNCNSSTLTTVAPKRKKPRQIPETLRYGVRRSPISAGEADQKPKSEISSSEKVSPSSGENGAEIMGNSVISQVHEAQPPRPPESKSLTSEVRDNSYLFVAKEEIISPKEKECSVVRTEGINCEVSTSVQTSNLKVYPLENHKEEKFEIDLMAPPPQVRSSSPERDTGIDLSYAANQKPVMSVANVDLKPVISKDNEDGKEKNQEEKRRKGTRVEESELLLKTSENNGLKISLQFDLEKKPESEYSEVNAVGNKLQKMPARANNREEHSVSEKHGQSTSSMPVPLSLANWPPMGYMAPLQGVVSMDGTSVASAPIQPMFTQPRPKHCATHCHIARNIYYQQQFMKLTPYQPMFSPLFGSNSCNVNIMPGSDHHGNVTIKGNNNMSAQDKAQNSNNNTLISNGEKGSTQPGTNNMPDSSLQRKHQEVLIQQALPPSSLMGPAFIFPFNQQQAALSTMPNTGKSQATGSSGSLSVVPQSMSLNYPSMAGAKETQYLAILQNNGYPFPIPAGTPPNFRGPAPQAMPMFNGSFCASPLIHPLQPPVSQPQQQNANFSNSSSSSQKHLQQRPSSGGFSSGNSNLQQNLGSQKSHSNQHANLSRPKQAVDGEIDGEDSPSNDGHRSRAPAVNMYGQNFPMPIHPQNFAVMTPSAAFGSQSEKKANQTQQQQQGVVVMNNVESFTTPHGFAMSFGPINGTSPDPSIDMSSMVQQHHAMFQASQKKNSRGSEDGKSGGVSNSSNANDDERKGIPGKSQGHSIAFTRSDLPDHNNNNRGHAHSSSRPSTTINVQNPYIQAQIQQQLKQQQFKQQQPLAANHRSKVPVNNNGNSVYTEHLNALSSTIVAKYPIVQMSSSSSPVQPQSQSPQWKGGTTSARTSTSQAVQSPLASSSSSNLKGVPQQNSRAQPPLHTQISFGASHNKPSSASSQGQVPSGSGNNLALSSPMMASVSPTTSSISKGASGSSPRLSVSASTNSKISHQDSSALSTQHSKNSQSMSGQKTPSILGNHPQVNSSSNSGAKQTSEQQHQQQQQLLKNMPQAQQLFFSNPFAQVQSSPTNASGPSASYYMNHQQKRPTDKNQQQLMQGTSSSGMLSLSPSSVALSNSTNANDPAKALAAATGAGKNGGLPSQGVFNASQFAAAQAGGGMLLPGFPYHQQPVAAACVQTKPAEQKQPAGNDNLRTWQPEKK